MTDRSVMMGIGAIEGIRWRARPRVETVKIPKATRDAVEQHLRWMQVRNLRPHSIYNRERVLVRLATFAGTRPLLALTWDDLRSYAESRVRDVTPQSRRTELSNIREFYRWAIREELIKRDPTLKMVMPRSPRGVPRPIREQDLEFALRASVDARFKVILGLAAFAGLRAGEIARLDWAEVGFHDDPPTIRIVDGKGGHGRLVPLAPALTELLRAVPDWQGPVIKRPNTTERGFLRSYEVSHIANTELHALGIDASLHQLRHRFGTKTYQACQDIRAVQDLLGHASPMSTAVYAASSSKVSRDAVIAASIVGGTIAVGA